MKNENVISFDDLKKKRKLKSDEINSQNELKLDGWDLFFLVSTITMFMAWFFVTMAEHHTALHALFFLKLK